MDVNGDGKLDLGDEGLDDEQLYYVMKDCEIDGNSYVDLCEFFECMEKVENDMREEKCAPGYPRAYCECPFATNECPYSWYCDDIE